MNPLENTVLRIWKTLVFIPERLSAIDYRDSYETKLGTSEQNKEHATTSTQQTATAVTQQQRGTINAPQQTRQEKGVTIHTHNSGTQCIWA